MASGARPPASFASLVAVALLFGALGPLTAHAGASAGYLLGPPMWPTICAAAVGLAAAVLAVRLLSSQGGRAALIASVGLLAAPLLLGPVSPGLIVVGSIGSTLFIPFVVIAVGLSAAHQPGAVARVALLVACGPLAWLASARIGAHSVVVYWLALPHIGVAVGVTAIAGTIAAASLWPSSAIAPTADEPPVRARQAWLSVGLCLVLAVLSNIEVDSWPAARAWFVLYLLQAIVSPALAAVCLLRLAQQHRASAYLAVVCAGRVLTAIAALAMG